MTGFTESSAVFLDSGERMLPDLVALRRRLHAQAEIGLHLPLTQTALLEELAGLDLEITTGDSLSSITAVLRGGLPGPTVLARGDMDGLPITEATGLDFAATTGAMHACGHDLHMAGLVGAARLLADRRAELPGTVIFMFQPGEEGYAGGKLMLDEGVLTAAGSADGDAPVAAFAIHVDCVTPNRAFVTKSGSIMASASGMTFTISAAGGHAASPHLGVDPVPVAAEIVLAIQSFVARRVPVTDPAVISIVHIQSNSEAPNVMPSAVELRANIRTLSKKTLDLVSDELPALVEAIAAAHRCTASSAFTPSYPVTYNDPAETAAVLSILDEVHGAERVIRLPAPSMASEDFAYVLEEVPGTLLFLGAMPVDQPAAGAPAMHSDRAVFDDSVLGLQAATLADLVWRRLHL